MKMIAAAIVLACLTACGGGGGGNAADPAPADPPAAASLPFSTIVVDGDSIAAASTWSDALPGRINVADSGSQSADVLQRWDTTVYPHAPSRVGGRGVYILVVGVNDCRKSTERMEVLWYRHAQIWAKARAQGFRLVVATLHSVVRPLPPVTDAQARACMADLNARILARPDLYDAVLRLDTLFPDTSDATMLSDGLHLTAAGSAVVADQVRHILASLE